MHGHAHDFALKYNNASRVFANNTNNVKLNKDSSFSNKLSVALQFQSQVSSVTGAIGSGTQFEL